MITQEQIERLNNIVNAGGYPLSPSDVDDLRAALEELDNPAAKLSDEAMNEEFSRVFNDSRYGENPELDASFNRTYHVWRLAFDSARAILTAR